MQTEESRKAQTDNLVMWKPGQSGNPKGRPKGSRNSPRSQLRHLMAKKAPEAALAQLRKAGVQIDDETFAAVLAARLVIDGIAGSAKAMRIIFDQLEMPLSRVIELTGPEGGPIQFLSSPERAAEIMARVRPALLEDQSDLEAKEAGYDGDDSDDNGDDGAD